MLKEYDKGAVKPRYLIAQAVILIWWALDWAILGTPDYVVGGAHGFVVSVVHSLIVLFAPFTLLVAVVVGLFDGLSDRDYEIFARMLVGGLAVLVSFLGLGLPELLQPGTTPLDLRIALLVAMELIMLVEWGMAALVRLGRRAMASI
jgi:hypothetical protein